MWIRRGAVTMVATLVAALLVGSPAVAGYQGEPMYGDINGDGLPDRITLILVNPGGRCGALVETGVRGGVYLPPTAYPYTVPGGRPGGPCPDLGTALDLEGDGKVELVVGWFEGRPVGLSYSLLILDDDITPIGTTVGISRPSFIGSADLDGDGRDDVYEWSDEGDGYVTFLSKGDSTLVPGPQRFCAAVRQLKLRDFTHDGALEALISYTLRCDDYSSGVVVVLDDGTVAQLDSDPLGGTTWTVSVVHTGNDRYPDVRTVNDQTGVVHIWLNDGTGAFTLLNGTRMH